MTNIGNQHFSALQSRAQNLHANTAQLDKQQKDVVKATEGLKKETEKLRKWADEGQRMVKELGNVQNWAEMLERDFLVLGETIRLANGGGSHSGSGSDSEWETDESEYGEEGGEKEGHGEEEGKVVDKEPGVQEEMRAVDAEGDTEMHGTEDKGKGKAVDVELQITSTEHQSEDLGGSSTATGSDPSSSSVHTAASAGS
jgi:GCN5-like protein 1 (GCN5L1)